MSERYRKPLVAVVGDGAQKVTKMLNEVMPHWDLQEPCNARSRRIIRENGIRIDKGAIDPNPAIAQLNTRIEQDGEDFDVLLFTSLTFDPQNECKDFERAIAEYAQYVLVGVVNLHPEYASDMRRRVEEESDGEITDDMFYILDGTNLPGEIDKATIDFIRKNKDDEDRKETADILNYGETLKPKSVDDIDEDDNDEYDEDLAYENVLQERGDGTIVCVTSSKGGSGKSTTAISLATLISHFSEAGVKTGKLDKPYSVALVDMDVMDGQIGFFTGHKSPTILTLYQDGINDKTLSENMIHDENLGVDLLLGAGNPLNAREISTDFFTNLINRLSKKYDFVILDTSVDYTNDKFSEICYPISDFIVFVTEALIPSVASMGRWVKHVTGPKERDFLGLPKEKIMVNINKYMSGMNDDRNMDINQIQDATAGVEIVAVTPFVPSALGNIANQNQMDGILDIPGMRLSILNIAQKVANDSLPTDDEYLRNRDK